jgi:uncharacterized protein (UPF0333 family)
MPGWYEIRVIGLIKNFKISFMNKKIIAGAVIALAAGVAAFIYNKKRNKVSQAARDAYNTMDNAIYSTERQTENIFS